ncbi:MAG: serine/threonine-protein kinase [Lentisphaeria bacterium]|nr:serine/threonine-protein kinase [Lentisphaeria bacterium]
MQSESSMGYLDPGTLLIGNYKYQVVSEVGRGAMAVVYLARQVDLERQVAVKVLSSQLSSNSSFVLRFFNEVRAAAAMSHPNIIQAYDAGIANGDIYYFAMEYVNGETLLRRILREGHLEVAATLKYASEIANALNYGWERQRLTHGDIKPENIMVNEFDQAKLADFGLAKVAGHEYEGHELMLTPHYASPELIRGQLRKGDCRSDIYAFGASIYHLLSGKPPFPGTDAQLVMKRHLEEELPPLHTRCSGIRPELADFIDSMLAKDAEQRPASWSELLARLAEIRASIAGTGNSDLSRIRLRRSRPSVSLPLSQHPGNASRAGFLPVKERKEPAKQYFWTVAIMISLAMLLFLSFLYWRKSMREQLEEKRRQTQKELVLVENKPQNTRAAAEEAPAARGQENGSPAAVNMAQGIEPAGTENEGGKTALVVAEEENGADTAPVAQKKSGSAEEDGNKPAPVEIEPGAALLVPYSLATVLSAAQNQSLTETRIFSRLAGFQYQPAQADSAELLMRLLDNAMGQDISSAGKGLLFFMQQQLISMLDEAPSQLLLHKQRLLGKNFSGKEGFKVLVNDVFPHSVLVEQILEKGSMRRSLSWRELSEAGLLLPMYKAAFFSPASGAKPELYLAQLLFSGNARSYQSALRQYADMGGDKLEYWEALGARLILSERELETKRELAELARLCQEGSRLETSRQARRLLRAANALSAEEKNLLESILAFCAELQLDLRAGALLHQAQSLMDTRPDLALQKIQFARCLAAAVKYPEREQLDALQQRALLALDSGGAYEMPLLEAPPWPFMLSRNNQLAATNYQWLMRLYNSAEIEPQDLAWQQNLAHLADANWQLALQGYGLLAQSRDAVDKKGRELLMLNYGCSLLQLYRGEPRSLGKKELDATQLAGDERALGKMLQQLFILMKRSKPDYVEAQNLKECVELLQFLPEAAKNAYLATVFAVLLESRQERSVRELWRALPQDELDETLLSVLRPLQEKDLPKTTENPGGLRSRQQAWQGLLRNFESRGDEYLLRLCLASMAEQGLDGHDDARMMEILRRKASAWSLLGGDAAFDWLLRRVAHELQNANLNAAYQICSQVLELEEPRLLPYYARIQMLRAALLCLQGQSSALQDLDFFLRNCLIANEKERRVCQTLESGAALKGETPYFWRELLFHCYLQGKKKPSSNDKALQEAGSLSFAAERALLQAFLDTKRH